MVLSFPALDRRCNFQCTGQFKFHAIGLTGQLFLLHPAQFIVVVNWTPKYILCCFSLQLGHLDSDLDTLTINWTSSMGVGILQILSSQTC
jgi:hypothetical protein